jgi:predicted permease
MPLLPRISSFCRNLIYKKRMDRELGEEIDAYLEMLIQQKLREGLGAGEARRAALLELGGRRQVKEYTWEARMGSTLETFGQDIRYGLRGMRRNPGFVLVAVLTLGLGIGANTAIFSLMDKLMLESLPVERPRELVMLAPDNDMLFGWSSGAAPWSYPAFGAIREQQQAFRGMLAERADTVNLMIDGATERATENIVSGDYFETLGVRAQVGRVFTPEDERVRDGSPVAVLSHGYWVDRLGSRLDIVGRTIRLNGNPFTVIGVCEKGFNGLEIGREVDVFVPISMLRQVATYGTALDSRTAYIFQVYGRLKPGITREQATNQLQSIYRAQVEQDVASMREPPRNDRWKQGRMTLEDGHRGTSGLRRELGTPLKALMAMTGVILLIACANLAGLLLARGAARAKEISIRLAIGAPRGRIIRQLLTESLLLAALGGLAGLFVARLTANVLAAGMVDNAGRLQLTTSFLDRRALLFAIAATAVTGVLFGLLPALAASRTSIGSTLKTGAGADGKRQARLRKTLATAQIALGLILVAASGLFLRTLHNLQTVNTGFRSEGLITFRLNSGLAGYNRERSVKLFSGMLDELRAIPGVSGATIGQTTFLSNSTINFGFEIEGRTRGEGENISARGDAVAPGYLAMLGTVLLRGRDFTDADTSTSTRVVIVNEALVDQYFPNQNPLGRKIRFGWGGESFPFEIVGVSKNARMSNLRDQPARNFFMPYTQWDVLNSAVFYVRSSGDPATLSGSIRSMVKRFDNNLLIIQYRTVEEQIGRLLRPERMVASLSIAFGLLATGLAAIGLYGVTAFSVSRRTREIGVRMALGAQRKGIVLMVLRDVMTTAAIGIVVGAALSLLLARYIESQLYGVPARDFLTLAAAAVLLVGVALAAGWLPARRASRVDPILALRQE